MKKILLAILLIGRCWAGTVSGTIQIPSSGTINNGTFTFTLSQSAIVSGTASVAPLAINCYTSNAGQIVGLPDPFVSPILATGSTGITATVFVKVTYYNASGETLASPESSIVLANQGVVVSVPALQPIGATGWKVYASTSTGTETLQNTQVGFASNVTLTSISAGAALPVSNTSTCSLRFNDELIPSGTNYQVNLQTRLGSQIAGFPQKWGLFGGSGGTINVSVGTPLFDGNVIYPSAVVSVPTSNGVQSISGPLNLGSFALTTGQVNLNGATSGTTVLLPQAVASGTLSLPAVTDTLVARTTTDTLTNKTLTSPAITTPIITGPMSGTRIPLVPFATGSAGSAIANTVTETASYTPDTTHIPAGTITAAGQILKAAYSGTYSTTGTPTLRSRFRLDTAGGTVIADSTALTTSNNAANLGVGLNVICVFSAVGAGGSAMCSGTIGLGGINVFQLSPVTLAFDTTVAHDFVATETWGTANASNTTTGQSLVIERPN